MRQRTRGRPARLNENSNESVILKHAVIRFSKLKKSHGK